jgi:hypothetical protein
MGDVVDLFPGVREEDVLELVEVPNVGIEPWPSTWWIVGGILGWSL